MGIIVLLAIGSAKAGMPWKASRDFINEIHFSHKNKAGEAAVFAHPGMYVEDQCLKSHGNFWSKINKQSEYEAIYDE